MVARRSRFDASAMLPFVERPVAVIGTKPDATALIDQVLTEFSGLDVDRLDASAMSLARLTRRDYGLVVVDVSEFDPLWFIGELTRRLVPIGRRGVPVVACVTPGAIGPGLQSLLVRVRAVTVERPFEASDLIQGVRDALDGSDDRQSAAWVASGPMRVGIRPS
jgi:hypothetical protein